jgi:hypothetical protein
MPASTSVEIDGELYGHRLDERTGDVLADVVHVIANGQADGPAENAFVFVERAGEERHARYISWINYYDLDYVIQRQPDTWSVVEPAESYRQLAEWRPFGWPGALSVPTVGDLADSGPSGSSEPP